MTQIIVTLERDANPSLLQKIFENIKGVLTTSVKSYHVNEAKEKVISKEEEASEATKLTPEKIDWLNRLNALCDNIDRSVIDLDDEKTRYILSK